MIGTSLHTVRGWSVQFDIYLIIFGRKNTCQNRRTYPLIYPGTRLSIMHCLVKSGPYLVKIERDEPK